MEVITVSFTVVVAIFNADKQKQNQQRMYKEQQNYCRNTEE